MANSSTSPASEYARSYTCRMLDLGLLSLAVTFFALMFGLVVWLDQL